MCTINYLFCLLAISAIRYSGLGRCCLVMNSSSGSNLGTSLVLASFLAGIRAEFRCFRSQITAQGNTGGWRSDRTSGGGNVHSAPAWILSNTQLLLRPHVHWEQSHEVRMRARCGQGRVAREGWRSFSATVTRSLLSHEAIILAYSLLGSFSRIPSLVAML